MDLKNPSLLFLLISLSFLALLSAKQQSWPIRVTPPSKTSKLPTRSLSASSNDTELMVVDLMVQSAVRVNVSFSDPDTDSTDDWAEVGIALYTSQSFLTIYGGSSLEFCYEEYIYNCSAHENCTATPSNTSSINYTNFKVSGYYGTPNVYLAYDYWSLATPALFVTRQSICDGPADQVMYNQYGYMGLGVAGDNRKNFIDSPVFSIYMMNNSEQYSVGNMDYIYGELVFDYDHDKVDTLWPWWPGAEVTLLADDNWNVGNVSNITLGNSSFSVDTTLIFDVDHDKTYLPPAIFTQVISALAANHLYCDGSSDYWTCSGANISTLPNLEILCNGTTLSIPPDYYYNGNSLSLSEQTAGTRYDNYIILGRQVMTYYYTVFDAKSEGNNQIKMYIASHGSHGLFYYIGQVLLGIAGIAVCICCCCLIMLGSGSSSTTTTTYYRKKRRLIDVDTGELYEEA